MEFHEKLQQLRKQKNLTQEELAELLFVSRTAISKWESGRGLPNIDSLKAISIDELLSGEEIIQATENEKRENAVHLRNILYGLMDIMCAVFFFVPIFGERDGNYIRSVSVLNLQFNIKIYGCFLYCNSRADCAIWIVGNYIAEFSKHFLEKE